MKRIDVVMNIIKRVDPRIRDIKEDDINRFIDNFVAKYNSESMHDYVKFMSSCEADTLSLYEVVGSLGKTVDYIPNGRLRDINFTKEDVQKCMHAFFGKYLPRKVNVVDSILNGTDPYFIDPDGNSHVYFRNVSKDDRNSSSVGHDGDNKYLEFNVYLHGSIEDLSTTAHELGHAISAHHRRLLDNVRAGNNVPKRDPANDCVGEIESHIIEGLFVRYLRDKKMLTIGDMEDYKNCSNTSLIKETTTITEEREVLKDLPKNFTRDDVFDLIVKYDQNTDFNKLRRIEKMAGERREGQYLFRYVVGRVVSDQWLKQYDNADENTKQGMLNTFPDYIDKTDTINLDDACEMLMGQNYACIVEDFATDKLSERKDRINTTKEFFK